MRICGLRAGTKLGWLEQQGPWVFGLNQHGHATMSSARLTIAENGTDDIEWYIPNGD